MGEKNKKKCYVHFCWTYISQMESDIMSPCLTNQQTCMWFQQRLQMLRMVTGSRRLILTRFSHEHHALACREDLSRLFPGHEGRHHPFPKIITK